MRGALAPLASEALVVLPVQTLRLNVPEWSDKVGDSRAYLATVDDEIAFAVRERGVRGPWAFPPDLARSARRNPGYAVDPYTISLTPLTAVERDPDKIIAEPLAGQLRMFAGLFSAPMFYRGLNAYRSEGTAATTDVDNFRIGGG